MDFIGKKMMIMGDNPESAPLVRAAQEMGVYTVVVGFNKGTYTKRIADKYYDIDSLNVDALTEAAKIENIDGVMVGVADILVSPYRKVCERLGLPCYATETAVKYLNDKLLFKESLQKAGLPVIPEYQDSDEYISGNIESIPLPVVVKPVDRGGGQGISIVTCLSELQEGIDKAIACSLSGKIQIEKYMQGDIIACYYTIIDGQVYISSVEDNLFTDLQGNLCPITTGHIYVSKYIDSYMEKAHDKICSLLNSIGAVNGVLQINAFIEDGEFYFYDPGFRLQGEAQHHILGAVNGFDHNRMLTEFALTGSMGCPEFSKLNDPYLRGKNAVSMWILLKQGVIGKIEGAEFFRDNGNVVFAGQRVFEGDTVEERDIGTEKQVFARIYIVSDDKKVLADTVGNIRKNLVITDINGNNMILDALSL
jgi:biotin carboxylase